jgi:hypothetical protein
LEGKYLGKLLLERMRRRWEDKIKVVLRERGCERRSWMELPQDYYVQWLALVLALLSLCVLLLLPEI